jgi:hypothetical protein
MRPYVNDEWGFRLGYPRSWEMIWKDEPAGTWMIPIGVAGPNGPGGRPCFSVNARREELLQGDSSFVVSRVLADGRIIQAPRSPAEYIELLKARPVTDLPGYAYTEGAHELSVSGCPAASVPARYDGAKGPILEETVTVFAPGRTFQLICETPAVQEGTQEHEGTPGRLLRGILASFTLI